jgi:hypothetical protein
MNKKGGVLCMTNPIAIRENIADLLKLDQEERKDLHTKSITFLIESLITYTRQLETELKQNDIRKIVV